MVGGSVTTRIRTGCRIHCGLLDLGRATDRAYGGAGFMIAGPGVQVCARCDSRFGVVGNIPLDERTRTDLRKALEAVSCRVAKKSVTVSVESMPPQHVGLGTKTALILGALLAAHVELNLKFEIATLQSLSGRGGTSGIGIHGFFYGGFVVDAGHPQTEVTSFLPSSSRRPSYPPMLNLILPIPPNWRFHLVLPTGIVREGSAEADFFAHNTPISRAHVFKAISLTYHGLVPAVRDANLGRLRTALGKLHRIGFKQRELATQSSNVKDVYTRLVKMCRAPVGLSSMGPLLYVILDARDTLQAQAVMEVCSETDSMYLGMFSGLQPGYSILT